MKIAIILFALITSALGQQTVISVNPISHYRPGNIVNNRTKFTSNLNSVTSNGDGTVTALTRQSFLSGTVGGDTITITESGSCYDGTWTVVSYNISSPTTLVFTTPCAASWTYGHRAFTSMFQFGSLLYSVYRCGASHSGDAGSLCQRTSSDNGTTWGNETTIFTDATTDCGGPCDLRTGNTTNAASGAASLWFARFDPNTGSTKDYKYVTFNGAWSVPKTFTTTTLGAPSEALSVPYGKPFLLGNSLAKLLVMNSGNGYLTFSCDNGATYGNDGSCVVKNARINKADGSPIAFDNEECDQLISGAKIIELCRGVDNAPAYAVVSIDSGATWTRTTTSITTIASAPSVFTIVSPFVTKLPDGKGLFLVAERDNVGGGWQQYLRAVRFDIDAFAANPAMGLTLTVLWSNLVTNDWGYPSLVSTSATTFAIQWYTLLYPVNAPLFTATGEFLTQFIKMSGVTVSGVTIK